MLEKRTFKNGEQAPLFEPTPEQIRESCAEIQAEWTPAEKRRRSNQRMERMLTRMDVSGKVARIVGLDQSNNVE